MVAQYIKKLENFLLNKFGIMIPEGVEFKRMLGTKINEWISKDKRGRGKVVNLSMDNFLIKNNYLNPYIEEVVAETIIKNDLKIFVGIVTYDGRGEAALSTGGNTFDNLSILERNGLITRFLSYQGSRKKPSPLCQYALDNKIKVYYVDEVSIMDKKDNELIVKKARGKTENILKFIVILNKEIKQQGLDPGKVFILFLDDDYCMLDDKAHYILIASWVLSYAKNQNKDPHINRLIQLCQGAGFIKNGGTRIHIHPYVAHKILRGEVIKNYRSLLIEAIKLDLDLGEAEAETSLKKLKSLIKDLESLPNEIILTPDNLSRLFSSADIELIFQIMKKFFYPGGRVCKPLTKRLAHESEIYLNEWLSRFTYILHGDQGTTLENWLNFNLGRGYAFETSVIFQLLMDKKFSEARVIDIKNTPHAHQPQVQPVVEDMEDFISLILDSLKVFYRLWSVDAFMTRYSKKIRVSWFSNGRHERTPVKIKRGILFYPPGKDLFLCRN